MHWVRMAGSEPKNPVSIESARDSWKDEYLVCTCLSLPCTCWFLSGNETPLSVWIFHPDFWECTEQWWQVQVLWMWCRAVSQVQEIDVCKWWRFFWTGLWKLYVCGWLFLFCWRWYVNSLLGFVRMLTALYSKKKENQGAKGDGTGFKEDEKKCSHQ